MPKAYVGKKMVKMPYPKKGKKGMMKKKKKGYK